MSNVTKGWKTSLIGLAMIGAAIASVLTGKSDWTGAVIAIGMGIGLLFSPDDIINKLTSKDGSSNTGQNQPPTPES